MLREGKSVALTGQAATDLLDIAFLSLARLDDSNRWVRQFSSAEEIAESSGITAPGLDNKRKAVLINAGLETFRRADYLSYRNGKYDVSHESFIRSWRYYQQILDSAQAVRKSIVELDDQIEASELPDQEQSGPGADLNDRAPNWLVEWWRSRQVSQAVKAFVQYVKFVILQSAKEAWFALSQGRRDFSHKYLMRAGSARAGFRNSSSTVGRGEQSCKRLPGHIQPEMRCRTQS